MKFSRALNFCEFRELDKLAKIKCTRKFSTRENACEIHVKAAKPRNLSHAAKFLKGKFAKLTCSENFIFYSIFKIIFALLLIKQTLYNEALAFFSINDCIM